MHRLPIAFITLLLALTGFAAAADSEPGSVNTVSFERRVAAQRALESLRAKHQIWPEVNPGPQPSVDELLSDARIQEKVRDDLAKSYALEKFWRHGISEDALLREMKRMAAETRHPERLRERFDALENSPLLIAECLARPLLADRLLRSWYAADSRFHRGEERRARREVDNHLGQGLREATTGEYAEMVYTRADGRGAPGLPSQEESVTLDAGDWDRLRQKIVRAFGKGRPPLDTWGPLGETAEGFFALAVRE